MLGVEGALHRSRLRHDASNAGPPAPALRQPVGFVSVLRHVYPHVLRLLHCRARKVIEEVVQRCGRTSRRQLVRPVQVQAAEGVSDVIIHPPFVTNDVTYVLEFIKETAAQL